MLELVLHPDSPRGPMRRVNAHARRSPEDVLSLSYALEGDLARVRIPRPRPARIGYRLWRHSCCEVFIARAGEAAYHELNFSPSGEWVAHAFRDYRDGAPLADESLHPDIAVQRSPERLDLYARVDLRRLGTAGAVLLGLAVIVEQEDGGMSFWALAHPPGKPDFHHRAGFALELA